MATIGEEIELALTSTNVTDDTDVFDNTIDENFPADKKLQDGDSIYQNSTGSTIEVQPTGGTYVVGDLVFMSDGATTPIDRIHEVTGVSGTFPKQPESYTSIDTSFNDADWDDRYMKFKDIDQEGGSINGVSFMDYTNTSDFIFNADGTKMYTINNMYDRVHQYELTTAWDISSAGSKKYLPDYLVSSQPIALVFNGDGSVFYYSDYNQNTLYRYDLSTAWDITTATYVSSQYLSNNYSLLFSPDGMIFYALEDGNTCKIASYSLTVAYDISSLPSPTYFTISSFTVVYGFDFSSDGSSMFIICGDENGGKFRIEYNVPTAWDISSGLTGIDSAPCPWGFPFSIRFSSDGKKMYELDATTYKIYQSTLSPAWDISTAFYSVLPAIHTETRDSVEYIYKIEAVGDGYLFTSTKAGVEDDYTMTAYTSLQEGTLEDKAYTGTNNTWLAKTLIIRPDALYIRTSVDAPIETEVLADYQYSVVNFVSSISGFSRIGFSNPYRPFDGANITPVVFSSPMNYTISAKEEFNAFTLAKVLASSITYSFALPDTDSAYLEWLDGVYLEGGTNGNGITKVATVDIDCKRDAIGRFSLHPTTVVYYADMQMPKDSIVIISLAHSDTISLGDFTLNNTMTGGFTNMEFTHTIKDFNDYTPDPWGNIPEGNKAVVTKFNISVDITLENYDHVVSLHESLVRKFITIDASDSINGVPDSQNIFASLIRRVRITSVSHKTIVKDGDMWLMANVQLGVQEIV